MRLWATTRLGATLRLPRPRQTRRQTMLPRPRTPRQTTLPRSSAKRADMTEHPGEQFPPDVDPDVEPGFDPYRSEEAPADPDYDTEPGAQDAVGEDERDAA